MWPTLSVAGLNVPTYLLIDSVAFSISVLWVRARAEKLELSGRATLDLCLVIMLGAFAGSRLFHVLFERPTVYLHQPLMVLEFWYGGFVYYGGFALALLLGYLYCRNKNLIFLDYADLFAPVASGMYAFGRLGCLAAGCCYGIPTTLPWGIKFPMGVEAPPGVPLHPTQIYLSLWETLLCLSLLFLERRAKKTMVGIVFGVWLVGHGLGRVVVEQFRGDFRGPTYINLSLSTWLSAVVVMLGFAILYKVRKNNAPSTL